MAKCSNCTKTQSRLNKGGLCKACKAHKCNPIITDGVIKQNEATNDVNKSMDINYNDFIKKEHKWNGEMQLMLKQQVEFLQQEIITKNTLIERLMVELCDRNAGNNIDDSHEQTSNNENTLERHESTLSEIRNEDNLSIKYTQVGRSEQIDNTVNKQPSLYPRCTIISHPNRYESLYDDCSTSYEDKTDEPEIPELPSRKRADPSQQKRPSVVINEYELNDHKYRQPRVIPGNSTYASMLDRGKKILLLSDSILGRIQIRKLNIDINNGHAFRKYYPGATPTELAYHCIPTLKSENPDIVVIHIGTNSIFKDSVNDTGNAIFNLVNICRDHGVGEIFISGITYRNQNMGKISRLNNFLQSQQLPHDFIFIKNDNINAKDLCNDNLHPNHFGIVKLANNITNAINALHIP